MSKVKVGKSRSYRTEKLIFAAYLIALDKAELVGVEPSGIGKNVTFVLSNSPTDEDLAGFFNGAGLVSALRFAESINALKGASHEIWRRNG